MYTLTHLNLGIDDNHWYFKCLVHSLHLPLSLEVSIRPPIIIIPAVLLRVHNLCPHLHDCSCHLDVLLAGPQVCPSKGDAHHHHPPGHVHHDLQHQQLSSTCGLYKGIT